VVGQQAEYFTHVRRAVVRSWSSQMSCVDTGRIHVCHPSRKQDGWYRFAKALQKRQVSWFICPPNK
jgi:hypothetical protein